MSEPRPVDSFVDLQSPPDFLGPDSAPPLGRIGPYLLVGKLGQGGMGAVYRAVHAHLQWTVALKTLSADRLVDRVAIARFRREAEVVACLDHPNVVKARDAGVDAGLHYLAMELLDGLDLNRVARRTGPLPFADACELLRQAALGLQHVHEAGLVHRDLKPSNLFLTRAGVVAILDLGLARPFDPGAGDDLTLSGQLVGTADFMAPEHADGPADARTDLYSLGCTLFKLLTGAAPFADSSGRTLSERLRARRKSPPPSLRSHRPSAPREVVAILGRLLARDPDERFASSADLADALAPCCAGSEPVALFRRAEGAEDPDLDRSTEALAAPAAPAAARTGTCDAGARRRTAPATALAGTIEPEASTSLSRRLRVPLRAACAALLLGLALGVAPAPVKPAPRGSAVEVVKRDRLDLLAAPFGDFGRNLLDDPPLFLLWPKRAPLPTTAAVYDSVNKALSVNSGGGVTGLFALGRTGERSFEIELEFSARRVGDVGVFLGYSEVVRPTPDAYRRSYQAVGLYGSNPVGRASPPALFRRATDQQGPKPGTTVVHSAPVDFASNRVHRLRVAIKDDQLVAVDWDGKPVPQLVDAAAAGRSLGAPACRGAFGAYTFDCDAVLRKLRFISNAEVARR